MKATLLTPLILVGLASSAFGQQYPIEPHEPAITLFESIDVIREFMKKETKYDYSDRNLTQVSFKFVEGHPRTGGAWVYWFSHKLPKRGNDLRIYHFTDDEILEFHIGS